MGDKSAFASEVNRVAFVSQADVIERMGEVPLLAPCAFVAVDFDAIIGSGCGDEIIALDASGALDTTGSELPSAIALGLDDMALVAEVPGIRAVRGFDRRAVTGSVRGLVQRQTVDAPVDQMAERPHAEGRPGVGVDQVAVVFAAVDTRA